MDHLQQFHVTTDSGEFTPEQEAAAAAAREQCKSTGRDIIRKYPIWFLAASSEGDEAGELGEAATRSLSSQAGSREHLIAFWCFVAQEAARQLAEIADCDESEAAVYLMREMMANVVLKDIPADGEQGD